MTRAERQNRSGAGPDVVVVGAGLAGLVCAWELERCGFTVQVVEARDRVGGRLLNVELPHGQPLEVGGQWVGPGQDAVHGLARRLGITTYLTHDVGQHLFARSDGPAARYRRRPPLPAHVAVDLLQTQARFDRLARQVVLEQPWRTRAAVRLDSQTVGSWLERRARTRLARAVFGLAIEAVFSVDVSDVSLLHALFYAQAAGGLDVLLRVSGGAQQERVRGGSQVLAIGLAEQLSTPVWLGAEVTVLRQGPDAVRVQVADGRTMDAARVVVAVPPALAGRVQYSPALPAVRDQLTQRMPMGRVIKVQAIYPTPFWRAAGLSGQAQLLAGPIRVVFDNTPPGGPGVLLAFLEGSAALTWGERTASARRAVVLDTLARLFGETARDPLDVVELDWTAEPWSRGGYAGVFGPGAWTQLGDALRAPVGRLHWAGTETAERWCGYMDGAVRSGQRAGEEVVAALRSEASRGAAAGGVGQSHSLVAAP